MICEGMKFFPPKTRWLYVSLQYNYLLFGQQGE